MFEWDRYHHMSIADGGTGDYIVWCYKGISKEKYIADKIKKPLCVWARGEAPGNGLNFVPTHSFVRAPLCYEQRADLIIPCSITRDRKDVSSYETLSIIRDMILYSKSKEILDNFNFLTEEILSNNIEDSSSWFHCIWEAIDKINLNNQTADISAKSYYKKGFFLSPYLQAEILQAKSFIKDRPLVFIQVKNNGSFWRDFRETWSLEDYFNAVRLFTDNGWLVAFNGDTRFLPENLFSQSGVINLGAFSLERMWAWALLSEARTSVVTSSYVMFSILSTGNYFTYPESLSKEDILSIEYKWLLEKQDQDFSFIGQVPLGECSKVFYEWTLNNYKSFEFDKSPFWQYGSFLTKDGMSRGY